MHVITYQSYNLEICFENSLQVNPFKRLLWTIIRSLCQMDVYPDPKLDHIEFKVTP